MKISRFAGMTLVAGLLCWAGNASLKRERTDPPHGEKTQSYHTPKREATPPTVDSKSTTSDQRPTLDQLTDKENRHFSSSILESIPIGHFRTSLEGLSSESRRRVLEQLEKLKVPNEDFGSIYLAGDESLYFACAFDAPGNGGAAAQPVSPPYSLANEVTAGLPVPNSAPPSKHSKPGSKNVIYLDFNGATIRGTVWNSTQNSKYDALPYDTDLDLTSFSSDEQAVIIQVWERVAEDYSPFDVDVTTEEPIVYTNTTAHALITKNVDANGVSLPQASNGGVAQIGVFGNERFATSYSPVFIYYNNVGSKYAALISEAVSHEVGHNLGLSHDGKTGAEYYGGHGSAETSWAPIMGVSYYKNVTQFSKGEYFEANNKQDDLSIIRGLLGGRNDEAGETISEPAFLDVQGASLKANGILGANSDVDVFAFSTGKGTVQLTVTPFRPPTGPWGANADIKLELLDGNSNVVATSDPQDATIASLTYEANEGAYYLRLSPAGCGDPLASPVSGYTSYGSIGQYWITGKVIPAKPDLLGLFKLSSKVGQPFLYKIVATNSPSFFSITELPTGLTFDQNKGEIRGSPLVVGKFSITLGASNAAGTRNQILELEIQSAPPGITSLSAARQVIHPGDTLELGVTPFSANGAVEYQWFKNGLPLPEQKTPTLAIPSCSSLDAGYYQVVLRNDVGETTSPLFYVLVAPAMSQLLAWGMNDAGQTKVPLDLSDGIAIACGGQDTVVVRANGSVRIFGGTKSLGNGPIDLSEVVNAQMGRAFVLALDSSGKVTAWGDNSYGQCSVPKDLSNVVQLAGGYAHSVALKSDGTVVCWGNNHIGQATVPAGLTDVVSVAAGANHSLALLRDGTAILWGDTWGGQLTVPAGLGRIAAFTSGDFNIVGIDTSGQLQGWGDLRITAPAGIYNESNPFTSGAFHNLLLTSEQSVVGWGLNQYGEITIPPLAKNVFAIAAGDFFSVALRDATKDEPKITGQPVSVTQQEGTALALSVAATGLNLQYQWYKNNVILPGEITNTLDLKDISSLQSGAYKVKVYNDLGTLFSRVANVVVATPKPGAIRNVSVRSVAGVNEKPLIVGFVISGGAKKMLIRATGPALAPFGVEGTMKDPTLEVHATINGIDEVQSENDNWGDTSASTNLRNIFERVGAFALPDAGSLDAALSSEFDGERTALVKGKMSQDNGIVLVEAYDVGMGLTSRLKNVSARNLAGLGSQTLIVGFAIDGNIPKPVLIRGIGPTLAQFGVNDVLLDPQLELHTTLAGADTIIATNDNWEDEINAKASFVAAGAFLLPSKSLDAVLVITLTPGVYSALVTGKNATTGEALVEVYEIP